jgi:MFS family permease
MQLVLTENRHLRIASFTIFYVAQGLPIGLLMIAIPAWLAGAGATATEIASYVSLAGLPWGLKLFAGPIMDRFSYLSMGRRRPWVVLSQSGLLLALFSMSLTPDPSDSIWLLSAMAFLVNMFAAVQDVAVDGMAIDVLEPDERGSANAFMACGQVVGYSGSGFVTAHALEYGGLALACFIVAFGVAFILLWSRLIKERSMQIRLPWTQAGTGPAIDRNTSGKLERDFFESNSRHVFTNESDTNDNSIMLGHDSGRLGVLCTSHSYSGVRLRKYRLLQLVFRGEFCLSGAGFIVRTIYRSFRRATLSFFRHSRSCNQLFVCGYFFRLLGVAHLSGDHCLLLFDGRPDGIYFVYRVAYERLLGESCRDAICDLHGLVKPV